MSVVVSTLKYAGNCTECAIATEGREALLSTYASHTSETPIYGVDIMDLPLTTAGNKHVIVFQDYLTKWPIVCPLSDQKVNRIAQIWSPWSIVVR